MNYPESLLQWIWENLQFQFTSLKTTLGEDIEIISPGTLNKGAGPDFKNAALFIRGVQWHGSIEIHLDGDDWYQHGHQHDPAYSSVVLHVVLTGSHIPAETVHGRVPHTLHIEPYLQTSLAGLLKTRQSSALPCSGSVTYLNQQAFEKQIEMAHKEYFEYKLHELLKLYDARRLPSDAWKKAFIGQIYRTLGVPGNSDNMLELYHKVSGKSNGYSSPEEWAEYVTEEAFSGNADKIWTKSGMRPAGCPERRVAQAAALQYAIDRYPQAQFLGKGLSSWGSLIRSVPGGQRPGQTSLSILEYTVFLPALYLLGKLFHDRTLMTGSYGQWKSGVPRLPSGISKPFLEAGFQIPPSSPKTGLVHQYKRYCSERRCHRCEVFKTAIRS
ncbi:DUF2851 family protein [Rhodohalobacter mucosus]|nr:DUF2851 family protein [Rhodohalobacter mucosus]